MKSVAQLTGEHAAFTGSFPLTKREYYAGLAMQGWLSGSPSFGGEPIKDTQEGANAVAACAVLYADALLAALEGADNAR